ncbi:protein SSUH2 homolog isoform X1 [Pungitius pungitius]|uniref:protein SSUH2 homolog isoform X1 n=1 Tax=Pungitius pungitius TaxID=134920 RepID=UPI002E1280EA
MNGAAVYPPPTGPAANPFGNMPGYESMAGGGFMPPPMPLQPLAPPQPGPNADQWTIPSLSEDAAREAFKNFASSHCCYSGSPADDGVITSMEPFNTYRYRLETFTETRKTEPAEKPYEGETADFYTQPAPRPWDVQVNPPSLFTNHTEEVRVPFTSSVKECGSCHGAGTTKCDDCKGEKHKECYMCHGSGEQNNERCTTCDASGRKRCSTCDARGTKDCSTCKGRKKLLTYINLKVEWTNNMADHVVQQNSGLIVNLQDVSGKELIKNNQNLLYPLIGFPEPSIAEASERLIKDHQTKYAQSARILQQRQTVELIPITKVNYKWKGGFHLYFVYGNEHKVSADNYPATCCCVIM